MRAVRVAANHALLPLLEPGRFRGDSEDLGAGRSISALVMIGGMSVIPSH